MNLETLCSPRVEHHFLAGVGKCLVNLIQRMDEKVSFLEKIDRSDRIIYFWNYNRLEDYLRYKYHCDFVDYLSSEEDFDDRYYEIRYFDEKNKNNYVMIKFDKKNKKGYILRKNRRINSYEIPLITDYITKKVIPYNQYMARDFHTFCGPKVEEFVLSVFPFFKVASEENIRVLLLKDRPFRNALKSTKHTFDVWYNRIMSFPNFSF